MNSQIANKLYNPVLSTDSYKFSHVDQVPLGTTKTYSHLTPRSTKRLQKNISTLDNKIVSFGLQYTIKHLLDEWNTYFFNLPWEEVNATVLDVLAPHIGFTAANMQKFKALHTLGYLPLEIKGIPEGDRVSAGIPLLTITNTHDDFDWLPNFLESKILNTSYIPFTVATLAYELAKLRDKYWSISADSEAGKEFALHDFHFRGAHTSYAAAISSMAYTLITKGTDTVNSIPAAQYYYNTENPTSFSIPATEHSTASLGIAYYGKLVYEAFGNTQGDTFEDLLENIINKLSISTGMSHSELHPLVEACLYVDNNFNATVKEDETLANKKLQLQQALGECFNLGRLLTIVYPTGLFAYVSDTYDFWRTVELIVPALKDIITKRDGKLILRPDSGNPVDVLCGQMYIGDSYEDLDVCLNENEYGWCYNEQGIKRYYKATDTDLELVNVKDIPAIQKGVVRSLWDTFGGTVNKKGFKVLDSHIGVVYGDGMFFERIEQIYKQTIDNEFSIENFCLAVGAWMLSGITRDDLGVAIKASAFVVNGEVVPVYKQPVTDASKNSVKGFLKVVKGENGEYSLIDNVSMEEEKETALQTIFLNGQLQNQVSYETVINRLFNS